LGFALGTTLLATSSASLALVAGVTPFIVGAAFPPVIAALIFVLISTSVYASAADYLGKTVSYLRAFFDKKFNHNLKSKLHEYRGSVVGVVLGLGVGVTLVLTLPFTGTGLTGAAVGSLIVLTAVGVVGGLVARIARLFDKLSSEQELTFENEINRDDSKLPSVSLENLKKLSPAAAQKVVLDEASSTNSIQIQSSGLLSMFKMSIFGSPKFPIAEDNSVKITNLVSLQSAS